MNALAHLFLLFVLFLSGCSGSKKENESADSVANVTEVPNPWRDVKLSPLEEDRLKEELFFHCRNMLVDTGDSTYVQFEDLSLYEGNGFKYRIHSIDLTLLKDLSFEELGDTAKIQGSYVVVDAVKSRGERFDEITVEIHATMDRFYITSSAYGITEYGQMKASPQVGQWPVNDRFTIKMSEPHIYGKDERYLKMRILKLTYAELRNFSKDDLAFMRNEIFARHGHTFKTQKMIDHFAKLPWYNAWVDDATGLLNVTETQNAAIIKSAEQSR